MTVVFRFRGLRAMTRVCLAAWIGLVIGFPAVGQQDKALAHLIKDQQNLLNRLQVFSEKLSRLSKRLDREGQAYAARLLASAHDHLTTGTDPLKDLMEAAKRKLEGEQLSEANKAQLEVLEKLRKSLDILLDRQNLAKLEAELAQIQAALKDLDQLRQDETRLLEETQGSRDPGRAASRQALKEQIEALRAEQKNVMEKTADRTPEEQAAMNRLRLGLNELARDQGRVASALEDLERTASASLGDRTRAARQMLDQYAETLRQAVQSTADPEGTAETTNPTARRYAREQARQAIEAFQKAAGRGEAVRKAFERAAELEQKGDQALVNGSAAAAREAYRNALQAAQQAAEQLKHAVDSGAASRTLDQLDAEQNRLQEALERLSRDLQEASVPEATRGHAGQARSAMEQALEAIRAHADAAKNRARGQARSGQQSGGSKNGQQADGSKAGQQSGGSKNRQQADGSKAGQQADGSKTGQQSGGNKNGQQADGSKTGQQADSRPAATPRASPHARSAAEALNRAAQALEEAEKKRIQATQADRERVAESQQELAARARKLEKDLEESAEQERSASPADPTGSRASDPSAANRSMPSPSATHAREAARQMEQAASNLRQGSTAQARDRQREARHRLQQAREALEKRGPSTTDPAQTRQELARWQKRLRNRARELARKTDQIGRNAGEQPEAAMSESRSSSLRRAERSMERARRALDQGRMDRAEERQQEAVAALNQAEREIKKRERNYLDMAQEEVIFRVGEQLRTVLQEQKAINERSVAEAAQLDPARPRMRRSVRRAFSQLVKRQGKTRDTVNEMIGKLKEEKIEVFLFVLNSIHHDMGRLTDRLGQKPPDMSRLTLLMQTDVVKNLQAILDTLDTEAKRRREERKSGKKPGGNEDEEQQGRKRLIPPTAELLMLKNYEVQVRERTEVLHQALAGHTPDQPVPDYLQNMLVRLAHQQGQIREVLTKFMKSLNISVQDLE